MVRLTFEGSDHDLRPSKIICLLRTYAAHARELSNEIPKRPRFFLKPPSSLLENGGVVRIPGGVENLHHEVELAIVIGKRGRHIREEDSLDHVKAYTVMLDLTSRDIQNEAREKGLPWAEAKGYDTFAPIGPEAVPSGAMDPGGRRIWLKVNGEIRQDGNTDLLLFPVGRIISEISRVMTLEEDDIIMTGTPAGVGPLVDGDVVEAGIDGIAPLKITVRSN